MDPAELSGMSLEQSFRTLFATHDGVPPRLFDPARSLALAEITKRDVVQRTIDLADMSRETDTLFRDYLSPFYIVGNMPQTPQSTWPVALARWTELLHHRANVLLARQIQPELEDLGFRILSVAEAVCQHGVWIHTYFKEHIYPLLTPLAVDPGRPFPYISSDSLNLLVELRGGLRHEPSTLMARVKIPNIAPRLIKLPAAAAATNPGNDDAPLPVEPLPVEVVWSVDLVRHFVEELFVGMPIRSVHCFRVLRASQSLGVNQPNPGKVHGRSARGAVVRVDAESAMPQLMVDWLVNHLDVISYSVVRYDSPDSAMSLPQLAQEVTEWSQPAA